MPLLLQKLINVFYLTKAFNQDGYSNSVLIRKALQVFKAEGLQGIRLRIVAANRRRIAAYEVEQEIAQNAAAELEAQQAEEPAAISIPEVIHKTAVKLIPYYIDPVDDAKPQDVSSSKLAVHLYAKHAVDIIALIPYLNGLPEKTDIYLSLSDSQDTTLLADTLSSQTSLGEMFISSTPEHTGAVLPMLVEYASALTKYDFVGHFDASADTATADLQELIGNNELRTGRFNSVNTLLQNDIHAIFSGTELSETDTTRPVLAVQNLIRSLTGLNVQDELYDVPVGSMFWIRASYFEFWGQLNLTYQQFAGLSDDQDLSVNKALLFSLCQASSSKDARYYYLPRKDSLLDYRQYEEKTDYSATIIHDDIQVLSYYLPQFHPIPENDLWHGKGFTEWTKVKAAFPLFKGHYQQQIPHEDIGYYLLDSPDTLRKQAELMKTSGVQGQIFYHYWFGGKLILEEPAQMLLANPDIDMPFSFCWANENWTKRWDGNESEVLLAQNYSAEDARNFIHYLIPFFKDPRHLTVDGRPVLWVYRPGHIDNVKEYIEIWGKECAKKGLPAPYVVAVLTRGITDPYAYHMDAAVERVLHDWTDGIVPDIRPKLDKYHDMTGSVLDYNQVADFYENQTEAKDFDYFRSLVPIWDNTARYDTRAILLHGGSPQRFQQWLERCIDYSRNNLPEDRRFVIVNAWNEWAEGAHLEPDTCHGYGYLNAVGRALSGIQYGTETKQDVPVTADSSLHITIQPEAREILKSCAKTRQKFLTCLQHSSIFTSASVSVDSGGLFSEFKTQRSDDNQVIDININTPALFTPDTLEQMYKLWIQCPESAVVANYYSNDCSTRLPQLTDNNAIDRAVGSQYPLIMFRNTGDTYKNVRVCTQAQSFALLAEYSQKQAVNEVSTVIRFHENGDLHQLSAALYCLAAMTKCQVTPIIAAQDLSEETQTKLDELLNKIPFEEGIKPQILNFDSPNGNGDIRSKMLNEALQNVTTDYATLLDYDDLLTADSYHWLISRLKKTGKAATFGRVYKTDYHAQRNVLLKRHRDFEYGTSYADFLYNNHAPLHSFMLDMKQLDVASLSYSDDQKYMEDYLLTLQLFKEDNCDWESLTLNRYIGDYMHSVDREHTLAFSEDSDKTEILHDAHYIECLERVNSIRQPLYKTLKN